MSLDIENIASKSQQIWRLIYEVIDYSYFEVVKIFPTQFLDRCNNNKRNLKTYQVKSKLPFKNCYGTRVVCTRGYDPQKGVRLYKRKKQDKEI